MFGWALTLTGDNGAAAIHQVQRQSIRTIEPSHLSGAAAIHQVQRQSIRTIEPSHLSGAPSHPRLEGATESDLRIARSAITCRPSATASVPSP